MTLSVNLLLLFVTLDSHWIHVLPCSANIVPPPWGDDTNKN